MKRFLMKDWKLAKVTTATATTSTTADTAAYLDTKGYENLCVLSRVVSTTGAPTVTLNLRAFSASTGTGGATTAGTVSWTAGTTGDVGAFNAPVNVKGPANRFFNLKITTVSGTAAVRSMYFLGAARHGPVTQPTATVKSTTVCT